MRLKKLFKTISALALAFAVVLGSNGNVFLAEAGTVSGGDANTVSGGDANMVSGGDAGIQDSSGTDNPDEKPVSTTKVKLEAPIGLHWEGNWQAQWNGVEDAQGYYYIEVWKDGEIFHTSLCRGWIGDMVSIDVATYISESGVYKFRVRANNNYDSENFEQSDWSEFSEERTYVRPTMVLGTATSLYWDTEQAGLLRFNNVDKASGYCVTIYRENADETKSEVGAIRYTYDDTRYEAGTESFENLYSYLEETNNRFGDAGRYYVTVRALSNNIDELANGAESNFSPVFDMSVTVSTVSASILDAIENSNSASEALDKITEENSLLDLRMAMQTDNIVLNHVKALEEQYISENVITVSKSVSDAASSYVDVNAVSMVGAGLNTDAGDICLDISVPEKKEFVNANHYANSVQMDIKLLHDGVPMTNLIMPVTVTMPIPEGLDASRLVLLHYNANGGFETVNLKDNGNGTVTFTVTHFSTFVFAEESSFISDGEQTITESDKEQGDNATFIPSVSQNSDEKASSNVADKNNNEEGKAPKTGENTTYDCFALLLISVLCGCAVLIGKKKERQKNIQ